MSKRRLPSADILPGCTVRLLPGAVRTDAEANRSAALSSDSIRDRKPPSVRARHGSMLRHTVRRTFAGVRRVVSVRLLPGAVRTGAESEPPCGSPPFAGIMPKAAPARRYSRRRGGPKTPCRRSTDAHFRHAPAKESSRSRPKRTRAYRHSASGTASFSALRQSPRTRAYPVFHYNKEI